MSLIFFSLLILSYVPTPVAVTAKSTKVVTKVTVTNKCPGTTAKFLVENEIQKSADTVITSYELGPVPGASYPLIICTLTQCFRYGNMTFLPGREYGVSISQCDLPGVRIESHETISGKSEAPPRVRFRARRVAPTEYRYGQTRFRRLSVGMSQYWSVTWPPPEGAVKVQFRYRLATNGPVGYLSTHRLTNLKPGHKYFVEVEYFGNQKEVIKIQDEGLSEK